MVPKGQENSQLIAASPLFYHDDEEDHGEYKIIPRHSSSTNHNQLRRNTMSQSTTHVPPSALQLPADQNALVAPSTAPDFVALGVGFQNYTCKDDGTYGLTGAVAELFDVSALYGTPEYDAVQDTAYETWTTSPSTAIEAVPTLFSSQYSLLGQHYFVPNASGTGSAPKFDFTKGRFPGNEDAFAILAKAGGLPAPTGSDDVDWLMLNGTSGKLASQVFRVNTKAGQPPKSGTPGNDISVKYTTKYVFYGASL
ncbi:hypothetical protein OF83DRAFT_1174231 [Amylostereum chailletii]|nr:hypothetical protein OF83DRAFT_1174231 [Amylostereum chailletii]